jgi:hypothetical protein
MTLVAVADIEGENQALRRISRMATPVPSTNPKTKDTNLDARRVVMNVWGFWSISLLGV